jgi:hypothetical protein
MTPADQPPVAEVAKSAVTPVIVAPEQIMVSEPVQQTAQKPVAAPAEAADAPAQMAGVKTPPASNATVEKQPDVPAVTLTCAVAAKVSTLVAPAAPAEIPAVPVFKAAEVNKLTQTPIGSRQNMTPAEQPPVADIVKSAVAPVIVAPEQTMVSEPVQHAAQKPVAAPAEAADAPVQMAGVKTPPASNATIEKQPVVPAETLTGAVAANVSTSAAPATPAEIPAEPVFRAAEVNKPMQTPVGNRQNMTPAEQLPVVAIAKSAVAPAIVAPVVEPVQQTAEKPVAAQAEAVDAPVQTVAEEVKAPPVINATVEKQPDVPAVSAETMTGAVAANVSTLAASATSSEIPAEPVFKTAEVNKPTQTPVDNRQNMKPAEQPPVVDVAKSTVVPANAAPEQKVVAEPVQHAAEKPVAAPVERATAEPATALNQQHPEKVQATEVKDRMASPALSAQSSQPAPSPEQELEIQLSQPRPVTARVVTASASADAHTAVQAHELRSGRQRINTDSPNEKPQADIKQSDVKEMASLLQSAVSSSESEVSSDVFQDGESNQTQPDIATGSQILEQRMSGQMKMEHQKSSFSDKTMLGETDRQVTPEQVLHQVKERLTQHDVKQGSQQITLTLSPDSLGELKMNLNLQGQKLSVEIVTENNTVRDAIAQHTGALKESLARQNITMESFDVTTGGKGSENQGQGQNQTAWRELAKQQQQQRFWTSPRGYQVAQTDIPVNSTGYLKQQGHSMLDIHY